MAAAVTMETTMIMQDIADTIDTVIEQEPTRKSLAQSRKLQHIRNHLIHHALFFRQLQSD